MVTYLLDGISSFDSEFITCLLEWYIRKHWRATACCGKSKFAIPSGWLKNWSVCHPDDLWLMQDVTRMTYDVALCHPGEITNLIPTQVIRMIYLFPVSHSYDLWPMHHVIRMGYLALVSHPDKLRQIYYVIQMTYFSILCHPDDLTEVGISSGWVTQCY